MTPPSPTIDDLDRLAFRLRRLLREQHPQLATHGFTLRDLEEHLLPFRETRREMADGSADAWERVLLRLLAGERDVIAAEPAMQRACRDALASTAPTLSLVRELGPRGFTARVLQRYDWNLPVEAAQLQGQTLEHWTERVLQRQAGAITMPAWQTEPRVNAHILDLHAYLSARADGRQGAGRPTP